MSSPPPRRIDLRSDTVTQPSPAMRRAMADALVGDDVLDGDPTTRRLEQRVAQLLGQEDALFFPSGTQANQTAIALLTRPGTELLLEANAHLVHYELAGVAANWGVQIRPVATPDGLLTGELVRAALRPASPHVPRPGAVAVENTHNAAGGKVLPPAALADIAAAAAQMGVRVHLDGARLWNAAAALGIPPARLTAGVATVMVSFSKGLGCPVGSCLAFGAGERARAWEIRKRLGGGMRQSGILAAAALYALDHNVGRLAHDHEHAKLLAERLCDCPTVRASVPETNIVMIDLLRETDAADRVIPKLAQAGVLVVPFGPRRLRAVTHLDVTRQDAERAAEVLARVLGG
ncbi:MAG TPA: GntG family PLP-dependent aldolase [Gemmatimonadales bacterium]|nr:GntG family PLP-dependent aldolase [Gemmatimonadales bacterium]